MRRLMWFSVGFAAACCIGAYLLSGRWLLLPCGFCAVGAAVFFFAGRSRERLRVPSAILLGCCIGLLWFFLYDICYLSTAREYDGRVAEARIEITEYSWETDYGVAADGIVTLEGKSYQVRIYLTQEEPLDPGDAVSGTFRFRVTTDGGEKGATYHQGNGIFLLAYARKDTEVSHGSGGAAKYFAPRLRRGITQLLEKLFPEDTLSFAKALLIGDTNDISYEMDTDLKISGIRHVIAVSGLHVSILFAFLYQLAGRKRVLTAVIGIPVLLLFAAVAGFSPSVTRSVIMQSLMILALLFNREYDPPTALAFAVLSMLVLNPLAATSVSLQLSAGCMVGIFLFSGRIGRFLLDEKRLGPAKGNGIKARLARWLSGSVSVSVSAMAATTPLSAFYFGTVSIIGILTNLLTLWAVPFAFYGIIAACVAGAVFMPLGRALAWVTSWIIRYITGVSGILAAFPLSAIYTSSVYTVFWIIFIYVLLGMYFLVKNKKPWLLLCCGVFGLLLSSALSWAEPRLDPLRVSVLDVGQGQSILLQSRGKNYLVDCGGDNAEAAADTAAQMLLGQGITRLDGLILTHYDKDHAGGTEYLLTRVSADTLYLPDISDDTLTKDALRAEYAQSICWISQKTVLNIDGLVFTFLPGSADNDDNESSMCILFQGENCDILITGDRGSRGERELLEQVQLPELELLVVGHHGSNSSTCFELLARTKPKYAAISVGEGNSYGHPSPEVLQRLELFGCGIFRTDLNGTIIFRG